MSTEVTRDAPPSAACTEKPAGVREHVEHGLPGRVAPDHPPVVALVEEEPGLLPGPDIDREPRLVLGDHDLGRRRRRAPPRPRSDRGARRGARRGRSPRRRARGRRARRAGAGARTPPRRRRRTRPPRCRRSDRSPAPGTHRPRRGPAVARCIRPAADRGPVARRPPPRVRAPTRASITASGTRSSTRARIGEPGSTSTVAIGPSSSTTVATSPATRSFGGASARS